MKAENNYPSEAVPDPDTGIVYFPDDDAPNPHATAEKEHMTYEEIAARAMTDSAFRDGLRQAAEVCRAQDRGQVPCPSRMAAVYLDRLANGEQP